MNASSVSLLIEGELDGYSVMFLVDTDASCSILLTKRRFSTCDSTHNTNLIIADGSSIRPLGSINCVVRIEDLKLSHTFICAKIHCDAILGIDILRRVHAVIDFSSNKLILGGHTPRISHHVSTVNAKTPWPDYYLDTLNILPDHQPSLSHLLDEFSQLFDLNRSSLCRTHVLQHHIETGENKPIYQPPRRITIHYRSELNALLEDMLNTHKIRPSSSPWASPIVLAKKKDGTLRLCIDYRRLNAVKT